MIVNYPRMRRRAAWPSDLDTALEFTSPEVFSIYAPKNWDGKIEYTNGNGWKTWDGSAIASGEIESNHYIYLRGIGNSKITGAYSNSGRWRLGWGDIACNGDIDLLLDYATVKSGNRPAMAASCYSYMFFGCTSLTTAPALPATTLAFGCYESMFTGCTHLTTVPALPATTLARSCYEGMFYNCGEIKVSATISGTYTKAFRIPKSGAGTTAADAMVNMFGATGGTFTGTPEINTTYYLDESNTIV